LKSCELELTTMVPIMEDEFLRLVDFIKQNYGINLREKKALVTGRLQNILIEKNYQSFSQYLNYVFSDPSGEAVSTLVERLTTNHTFFLREAEHFKFLRTEVLPVLKSKVSNHDLRIWSAGCSSGEEPYTLAMTIADFLGMDRSLWDSRVLATDISERVLEKAKRGIYSNEQIKDIPDEWRRKYFVPHDQENSQVGEVIRNNVIFRRFNLMNQTYPFKQKFHVIFCRNVMIYFDPQTRRELVDRFYNHLESGGFLFIGLSESLRREETKFQYIRPSVYRKE
jgi:chemotaxis protein methyltransferase CheR